MHIYTLWSSLGKLEEREVGRYTVDERDSQKVGELKDRNANQNIYKIYTDCTCVSFRAGHWYHFHAIASLHHVAKIEAHGDNGKYRIVKYRRVKKWSKLNFK